MLTTKTQKYVSPSSTGDGTLMMGNVVETICTLTPKFSPVNRTRHQQSNKWGAGRISNSTTPIECFRQETNSGQKLH